MKELTLLFLHRDDEILLAMKKRGFGEGRWNGVGGKLEPGETIEQALVRECQEEIKVTPLGYDHVAQLSFDAYLKGRRTKLLVHAYLCEKWQDEPAETEEMRPQWFKKSAIPYEAMWQDDKFWLPLVLQNKKVKGSFVFDEKDNLLDHTIEEIDSIEEG
jgi:8-oxo-dGTP diphosphatase